MPCFSYATLLRTWCRQALAVSVLAMCVSACGSKLPEFGKRGYTEEGKASYYSPKLQGRKMADGSPYRRHKLTAAHRTLSLGTKVKVTNLQTSKTVRVKITDRGPFVKGRVVDLSEAAARRLGYLKAGVVPVKVKVVRPAKSK